jgi:glycosyltransferase involved in cell wall biosynthesis
MGHVAYEYTERLRRLGHAVHVFTPEVDRAPDDPPYVHRLPVLLRIGNAALTASVYRRLNGFDVVHLHYPFFGGAEWVLVRRSIEGTPRLVLSFHMDATAKWIKGAILHAYRQLVFPRILARADRVLVSSFDYAKTSAVATVTGVLERVEVHPFGVDFDRFHPGPEPELRSSLHISDDATVIVFVGSLDRAHHFKGLPVLFAALAELSESPWHLVVVGSGSCRLTLQELADSCGIAAHVQFVGDVSQEDLPRYYRVANVHVLPSTDRIEAFGLVTLEASASGIPSVVSALPGVRTLVVAGETGIHVSPGDVRELRDALQRLIRQPEQCARLGAAARARAKAEFAWEPLIDRLSRTYCQLLNPARDPDRSAESGGR